MSSRCGSVAADADKKRAYSADEILAWLTIVSGPQWRVAELGLIRDDLGRCPLCALADEIAGYRVGPGEDWWGSFEAIGLSPGLGLATIAVAADSRRAKTRPALMAALGMHSG